MLSLLLLIFSLALCFSFFYHFFFSYSTFFLFLFYGQFLPFYANLGWPKITIFSLLLYFVIFPWTKILCAFFLIFVLVLFSWEPMYKSILIAFLSWKLTLLGNPSVNLGQQKGFLLKTGRGTFQRFLWVDGDFSY